MKNTLNAAVAVDPSGKLEKATNFRWILVFIAFLLLMVAYFDRVNIAVCGPMMMETFGISKVQLGTAMSAFFVAYVIMQIPGGILSEKFGIRLIGSLAIIASSVLPV